MRPRMSRQAKKVEGVEDAQDRINELKKYYRSIKMQNLLDKTIIIIMRYILPVFLGYNWKYLGWYIIPAGISCMMSAIAATERLNARRK